MRKLSHLRRVPGAVLRRGLSTARERFEHGKEHCGNAKVWISMRIDGWDRGGGGDFCVRGASAGGGIGTPGSGARRERAGAGRSLVLVLAKEA